MSRKDQWRPARRHGSEWALGADAGFFWIDAYYGATQHIDPTGNRAIAHAARTERVASDRNGRSARNRCRAIRAVDFGHKFDSRNLSPWTGHACADRRRA